jgi:nitroimidazol reductase NimA-like FMN-containing flavoprotein (pyridoxamine 5'-phosphate oxidase superfamily)
MEITMDESNQLVQTLKALFSSQRLAILATEGRGQPYGSLVAFAATDSLRDLLFATTRSTRKYANLAGAPRAAMVIDNRTNQESDFHLAMAATATGVVNEVEGAEKESHQRIYLSKHPYLREFVSSPTCALFRLEVKTYFVVRRFQNVTEVHIRP